MTMKWFLWIFQLIFVLSELSGSVNSECFPHSSKDEKSANLIKQLDPLKGRTFYDQQKDPTVDDEYKYTFRICEGVNTDTYKSSFAGVIQQKVGATNVSPKIIGSINNTIVKSGTDWMMLTYRHGDKYSSHCSQGRRQAHIMIVCDPTQLVGTFKVLYEHNAEDEESGCFYLMELPSSVACTSLQVGLSNGSIFLIIFFTFAIVYLIIGAIYKRCVFGSKGWDQIPNVGFWKSFGNLQSDGCNFLCRCSGSGYSSSRPYQGIADDQLEEEIDDEHLLPM